MNELVPKADIGGEGGEADTTKQVNNYINSHSLSQGTFIASVPLQNPTTEIK